MKRNINSEQIIKKEELEYFNTQSYILKAKETGEKELLTYLATLCRWIRENE